MSLDFTALNRIPAVEGSLARAPSPLHTGGDALDIYATHQQNVQRAGNIRSDIAKGIQRGVDPLALLLKALECISLMTGDTVVYTQGEADILAIYGWGLDEPAPLELELERAQIRLERLTSPEVAQYPTDVQERIQRAVRAHKDLIDHLQRKLAPRN